MSSPVPTITPTPDHSRRGSAWEVFLAFLQLGLTSFGGPIAHLAYFRAEFVQRRHWLDDQSYSDLVALCQFLPGPASSQVGIALGWGRAGWRGAAAAWSGFTLPSALVLIVFALGIQQWSGLAQSGAIHGLKVVAVAVVAQAVWAWPSRSAPMLHAPPWPSALRSSCLCFQRRGCNSLSSLWAHAWDTSF